MKYKFSFLVFGLSALALASCSKKNPDKIVSSAGTTSVPASNTPTIDPNTDPNTNTPAIMPAPNTPDTDPDTNNTPAIIPAPNTPAIIPAPNTPAIIPAPNTPAIIPAPNTPAIIPAPNTPAIIPAPNTPAIMPSPFKSLYTLNGNEIVKYSLEKDPIITKIKLKLGDTLSNSKYTLKMKKLMNNIFVLFNEEAFSVCDITTEKCAEENPFPAKGLNSFTATNNYLFISNSDSAALGKSGEAFKCNLDGSICEIFTVPKGDTKPNTNLVTVKNSDLFAIHNNNGAPYISKFDSKTNTFEIQAGLTNTLTKKVYNYKIYTSINAGDKILFVAQSQFRNGGYLYDYLIRCDTKSKTCSEFELNGVAGIDKGYGFGYSNTEGKNYKSKIIDMYTVDNILVVATKIGGNPMLYACEDLGKKECIKILPDHIAQPGIAPNLGNGSFIQ